MRIVAGFRALPDSARVLIARWQERLRRAGPHLPRLLGVSVHNKLRAEGFDGGYSTITRADLRLDELSHVCVCGGRRDQAAFPSRSALS